MQHYGLRAFRFPQEVCASLGRLPASRAQHLQHALRVQVARRRGSGTGPLPHSGLTGLTNGLQVRGLTDMVLYRIKASLTWWLQEQQLTDSSSIGWFGRCARLLIQRGERERERERERGADSLSESLPLHKSESAAREASTLVRQDAYSFQFSRLQLARAA